MEVKSYLRASGRIGRMRLRATKDEYPFPAIILAYEF
jgi:hypothetical protein